MPYFYSDRHPDCDGWALLKEDGALEFCHPNRQAAIDHMIAISLAEELEPGGEYEGDTFRSLEERLESGDPAIILDIDNTLFFDEEFNQEVYDYALTFPDALIYIVTARDENQRERTVQELEDAGVSYTELIMKPSRDDDSNEYKRATAERLLETLNVMVAVDDSSAAREAYASLGILAIHPDETPVTESTRSTDVEEKRDVDLTPPAYMRAAARRGVELYEEGLAGDGVTEQTIREARAMARGNVSVSKWNRIAPWIARHMTDLDAQQNQPGGEGFPGAGAVAFYLWGAVPTKRGAERVQGYAEGIVDRIERETEGRVRGEMAKKFETRTVETDFEIRQEGDSMTFSGYAALFDSPSHPLPFTERIKPGAFTRSLKSRNNVFMFYNHDSSEILASTRAGTLRLEEDARGLRVEADIAPTSRGKDVSTLIKRGDLYGMSFGFSVPTGGDEWNADGTERTLNSVRLGEVSIVGSPAYPQTEGTVAVRGLDKLAQRADVDADALADALVKLETGETISDSDKEILNSVISTLSPEAEEKQTEELTDKDMLELKKKKLALMMKEMA